MTVAGTADVSARTRRGFWMAVAFTAATASAVGATALPYPFAGQSPPYDAAILLQGVEVIALVWAGFFAGRAYQTQQAALDYQRGHDAAQQQAKRRSLALAMQAEVESLTAVATALLPPNRPAEYETRPTHPIIDRALASAEVFQPLTGYRMADVLRHTDDLGASIGIYIGQVASLVRHFHPNPTYLPVELKVIEARAGALLKRLYLLATELENEAREHPEPRPMPVTGHMALQVPGSLTLAVDGHVGSPEAGESGR